MKHGGVQAIVNQPKYSSDHPSGHIKPGNMELSEGFRRRKNIYQCFIYWWCTSTLISCFSGHIFPSGWGFASHGWSRVCAIFGTWNQTASWEALDGALAKASPKLLVQKKIRKKIRGTYHSWLVVWNMTFIFPYFPQYIGMMIQSDFHIFQRGRYTTKQTGSFGGDIKSTRPGKEWERGSTSQSF